MVNDEMLKKLKDQYIGVEVPDDEKNKLNEILEYAKIDRKRKRKKSYNYKMDDFCCCIVVSCNYAKYK